jgi:hypothetical protein
LSSKKEKILKIKIMGILRNGVFGTFERRTGLLVGRVVNKRNVISMRRHKPTKLSTAQQQQQQMKFVLVVKFFSSVKDLLVVGFAKNRPNSLNAAIKYNFKSVVEGVAPEFYLDYSRVVFGVGRTARPCRPMVDIDAAGNVVFSWQAEPQNRYSRNRDKACFLVYNATKKLAVRTIKTADRVTLNYTMVLPSGFAGDEMHCYMSFVSADGREPGRSVYLGILNLK